MRASLFKGRGGCDGSRHLVSRFGTGAWRIGNPLYALPRIADGWRCLCVGVVCSSPFSLPPSPPGSSWSAGRRRCVRASVTTGPGVPTWLHPTPCISPGHLWVFTPWRLQVLCLMCSVHASQVTSSSQVHFVCYFGDSICSRKMVL